MGDRAIGLHEFIAEFQLWGNWEICYTDGTHLRECDFVKLGDVIIDVSEELARYYPILPFEFRPATHEQLKNSFARFSKEESQINRAIEFIQDQLLESLVRSGLLRPNFRLMEGQTYQADFPEIMSSLSRRGYLIIVVDTSALRRASVSFLHSTLSEVLIWTVVPVFVMNEVQRNVKKVNDIWDAAGRGTNPHLGKCGVLSTRPLISCVSQELNFIRQWRPLEMLTTLPEHLHQSDGDSRADRLIIESVKNLKRERGFHQGVFLLTGDKDMASLATLENQGSLCVEVPTISKETKVSSVRYDSHNQKLVLTPVHCLLWDLALVFGKIRFTNTDQSRTYELNYYSPARGGFLARTVMGIRELTDGPNHAE